MSGTSKYDDIIQTAVRSAAGAGVVGGVVPAADLAAMSGIWITMIMAIANRSGHPLNEHTVAKVVGSIGAGMAAYVGGSRLFSYLLHLIPGVGTLGVVSINAMLNAVYTYRLGCRLAGIFEQPTFTMDQFIASSMTIARLVVGLPTTSEMREIAETLL